MKQSLILIAIITTFAAAALAQAERIGFRQWKLVQLDGIRVAGSSTAYLQLDPDPTRFTGSTGCNRMFGAVAVDKRRLSFSNIGTTKMACADPRVRRIETAFIRALGNVDRYRETGNSLELYSRGRLVMKFNLVMKFTPPTKLPAKDPVQSMRLEDKKWMLEAIEGIPVSTVARTAFVVFNSDKQSAGGNTSCNVFGGTYSTSGSTLKITDVISTERACEEDNRMTIERQFLDGLQKANRYDIQGAKLMLYENRRLLLTLTGQAK